jgi:glycosyltransferase involved in cell wall biosynthesis
MHIALINEGTYPFAHGGISVWCHSLIGRAPHHEFELVSIVANNSNTLRWERLPNVVESDEVVLWPPVPRRALKKTAADDAHRTALQQITNVYNAIGRGTPALRDFESALRVLHLIEAQPALDVFGTERTVESLYNEWNQSHPDKIISLYDALIINDIISHLMRPLWFRTRKVDINHAVANGLAVLVCMAGKWDHNTPFVLSEHGVYLRERYLASDREQLSDNGQVVLLSFYKMIAAMGYKNANAILPVSDFNARWARYQGAPKSKITTIYNGVDADQYAEIDTEPRVPTVSWVGRIDPVKDLETLIRAFAVVRLSVSNAVLRLFGPVTDGCDEYAFKIRALAKQILPAGSYMFEGSIKDASVGYRAGHVVALSSKSEGLPFTVLEAMMCGRATVSTDVGGVSELVGNGGLIVPAGSPAKLGEALVQVLQDHGRRQLLGKTARERALQLFQVPGMVDQYERAYAKVKGVKPFQAELKDQATFVVLDTSAPDTQEAAQGDKAVAS